MTLQERIDAALRWPERKLLQDCRAEIARLQAQLDAEVAERSRLRGEQQRLTQQLAEQTKYAEMWGNRLDSIFRQLEGVSTNSTIENRISDLGISRMKAQMQVKELETKVEAQAAIISELNDRLRKQV